jgi:hypothetical protein
MQDDNHLKFVTHLGQQCTALHLNVMRTSFNNLICDYKDDEIQQGFYPLVLPGNTLSGSSGPHNNFVGL